MAIKLPRDFIESDYRFTAFVPKPKIETEKKPDGSFKMCASYDASEVRDFAQRIANDMNEKLSAELIDELLRLNGYVPERTCHMEIVKRGPLYVTYRFDCCDREWTESMTDAGATDLPGTVCPFCGAKVVG